MIWKAPLELVHTDVRSVDTKSHAGSQYFVLFIDDHSRKMWVSTFKTKGQVLSMFKEFLKLKSLPATTGLRVRNNSQSNGEENQNTEIENDTNFNVETQTGEKQCGVHKLRNRTLWEKEIQSKISEAMTLRSYGDHTLPLTLGHSHRYRDHNLNNSNFTIIHTHLTWLP